jgi:pimeloyl-ACP methyl ester carboxylesterase
MSSHGLENERYPIGEANYFVSRDGSGPAVLLLHGFPETHACWDRIAPRLAEAHRIVAPDLRGYGASEAPSGGPRGEGYSKREMAAELVKVMAGLGHERFAVVGHDRGARVAYRLALDHPQRITRVALLNVVPTIDQFERMVAGPSLGYWPWFLLAQPEPFPERVLLAEPGALLDHVFATWPSNPKTITAEQRDAYLQADALDRSSDVRRLPRKLSSRSRARGRRSRRWGPHHLSSTACDRRGRDTARRRSRRLAGVGRGPNSKTSSRWPLHPRRSARRALRDP